MKMAVLGAYMAERVKDPQTVQHLRPVWRAIVKRLDKLLSANSTFEEIQAERTNKLRASLEQPENTSVSRKKSIATTSS